MKPHWYLLDTKWLSIYLNGSYCRIEIDLFRWVVLQFFTKKKKFEYFYTEVS